MAHSRILGELTIGSIEKVAPGNFQVQVDVPQGSLQTPHAQRWLGAIARDLPAVPARLAIDNVERAHFNVTAICEDPRTAEVAVEKYLGEVVDIAGHHLSDTEFWDKLSGKIDSGPRDYDSARIEYGELSPGEVRNYRL